MKTSANPNVLEWAVERSGKRERLEQKIPQAAAVVGRLCSAYFASAGGLARAATVPFGYLLLQKPPQEKLSIPFFRTVDDRPSPRFGPDLLDTVHLMRQRQEWLREYSSEQDAEPLPFVNSATVNDDPVQIAAQIRTVLSLNANWAAQYSTWTDALRALRNKIESIGIVVVVNGVVGNNSTRKLDPVRGFVLVDEYPSSMALTARQRRCLRWRTNWRTSGWGKARPLTLRELRPADDRIERVCNQVAAEFLVAQEQLSRYWPTAQSDPEPIQAVAPAASKSAPSWPQDACWI